MAETDGIAVNMVALDMSSAVDRFRIGFVTDGGEAGAVSLPLHCLDHLVVTLPRIAAAALNAGRRGATISNAAPSRRLTVPGLAPSQDVVLD